MMRSASACAGEDVHKVLWLKSRNSEVWLERRTTYTRSCAVMSMVAPGVPAAHCMTASWAQNAYEIHAAARRCQMFAAHDRDA